MISFGLCGAAAYPPGVSPKTTSASAMATTSSLQAVSAPSPRPSAWTMRTVVAPIVPVMQPVVVRVPSPGPAAQTPCNEPCCAHDAVCVTVSEPHPAPTPNDLRYIIKQSPYVHLYGRDGAPPHSHGRAQKRTAGGAALASGRPVPPLVSNPAEAQIPKQSSYGSTTASESEGDGPRTLMVTRGQGRAPLKSAPRPEDEPTPKKKRPPPPAEPVYFCGRCGQPKRGHICPLKPE